MGAGRTPHTATGGGPGGTGFWTGAGLGALGGYLFGRRNQGWVSFCTSPYFLSYAASFVRECVFVELSLFTFDTFAVMRAAISNGNMECHRNSREIRDSPRSGRARVGRRRRPVAARRRRRTRVRVSERVYCNVREKITGFEVDGELGFAGFGGTRRR
jgi:hypothetical protein